MTYSNLHLRIIFVSSYLGRLDSIAKYFFFVFLSQNSTSAIIGIVVCCAAGLTDPLSLPLLLRMIIGGNPAISKLVHNHPKWKMKFSAIKETSEMKNDVRSRL